MAEANALSAPLSDLTAASRYAVRVRAVNAAGPGLWETVQFETDEQRFLPWKLATAEPAVYGPVERLSDVSARHTEPNARDAFIQGDTPLSVGRHAWRARLSGSDTDQNQLFGVIEAGKALAASSYTDPSFYGIYSRSGGGGRWTAGMGSVGDGVGDLRSGDTLDLLLDIDRATFSIVALKDGKRADFEGLPAGKAWVPYFWMYDAGHAFTVEVIDPEQFGRK